MFSSRKRMVECGHPEPTRIEMYFGLYCVIPVFVAMWAGMIYGAWVSVEYVWSLTKPLLF